MGVRVNELIGQKRANDERSANAQRELARLRSSLAAGDDRSRLQLVDLRNLERQNSELSRQLSQLRQDVSLKEEQKRVMEQEVRSPPLLSRPPPIHAHRSSRTARSRLAGS